MWNNWTCNKFLRDLLARFIYDRCLIIALYDDESENDAKSRREMEWSWWEAQIMIKRESVHAAAIR